MSHLLIFFLSSIVGIYLVSNIDESLHAVLMSLTNTISSVIFVILTRSMINDDIFINLSLFLCFINMIGGLYITYRMLSMLDRNKS